MRTREQILADIKTWDGLNKYIVRKCKLELRELESAKQEPKVEKKLEEVVPSKMTASELKGLNKDSQVEILKGLGADSIPRLEKDRIKLILKLQK